MTNVLYVEIDGTEYGPMGANRVLDDGISLQAGGAGAIGTATILLNVPSAGAYTIRSKGVVRIGYRDSATNVFAWRWFRGTVSRQGLRRLTSDLFTVAWAVDCVDINEQFFALVHSAAGVGSAVPVVAAGSFAAQVQAWTELMSAGGSATEPINGVDYVLNLWPGPPNLPAITRDQVAGKTYLDGLKIIFANARLQNSALRPSAVLMPQAAPGGTTFDLPYLSVIDAAAPGTPRLKFADSTVGGYYPIIPEEDYERQIEAAHIVEKRQSVQTGVGAIYTGTQHSSSVAPNVNSNDGYWWDVPLSDDVSQDATAAQAYVDRSVQTTAIPRETQTILVAQPVRPGEPIQVRQDLLGTDTVYMVVGVDILLADPTRPLYRLTLGSRKLRWGETEDEDVFAAPILADHVPPEPPTSFAQGTNTFNVTSGKAELPLTWVASVSADVNATSGGYRLIITEAGVTTTLDTDGITLSKTLSFAPNVAYSVKILAFDGAGNLSTKAGPLTGTSAAIPSPAAPTSIAGTGYNNATGKGGPYIGLTWTASADTHDYYDVKVQGPTGAEGGIQRISGTLTAYAFRGLTAGLTYSVYMRAVRSTQYPGPWSTPAVSVLIPRVSKVLAGFDGQQAEDVTKIDGWLQTSGTTVASPRDTTNTVEGGVTLAIPFTAGDAAKIFSSDFIPVKGGDVWSYLIRYKVAAVLAGLAATATVTWYDATFTILGAGGTSTLTLPAATTAFQTSDGKVSAPATALYARLNLSGMAPSAGSGTVYHGPAQFSLVESNAKLGAGSVTNTILGTITDPTKFEFDIETNPLQFYAAGGSLYRGQLKFTSGATEHITLTSNNPNASTALELATGSASILLGDSTGGNLTNIVLDPGTGSSDYTRVKGAAQARSVQINNSSDARVLKWGAGTAFPGSPGTNDEFTRTDLGNTRYYYDGTRWLSTTLFIWQYKQTESTWTGGTATMQEGGDPASQNVWFEKVTWKIVLRTQNTASHKYALITGYKNSGLGGTTLNSIDTSSPLQSIDTVLTLTGTIGSAVDFSSGANTDMYLAMTKTGSPGDPEIKAVTFFYRLIGS